MIRISLKMYKAIETLLGNYRGDFDEISLTVDKHVPLRWGVLFEPRSNNYSYMNKAAHVLATICDLINFFNDAQMIVNEDDEDNSKSSELVEYVNTLDELFKTNNNEGLIEWIKWKNSESVSIPSEIKEAYNSKINIDEVLTNIDDSLVDYLRGDDEELDVPLGIDEMIAISYALHKR